MTIIIRQIIRQITRLFERYFFGHFAHFLLFFQNVKSKNLALKRGEKYEAWRKVFSFSAREKSSTLQRHFSTSKTTFLTSFNVNKLGKKIMRSVLAVRARFSEIHSRTIIT